MTAVIRPAVPEDRDPILAMRAALNAHAHAVDARIGDRDPAIRDRAGVWFNFPNPFPPILVADDHGAPVGLVVTQPGRPASDGSVLAHLELLYVAPSHRRQGVGRALVHAALDQAAANGPPTPA